MIDDDDSGGVRAVLAANLRRLRIARHVSLSELARATGVGKATLSGIENGRANPTVETLAALAGALRASLGELLEEPPLGEMRVVRATHGEAELVEGVPRRALETIPARAGVEAAELVLAAGRRCEAPPRAGGTRAHVYVRSGKLIAGPSERQTELARGDYASFPADVPHVYEAPREPARALLLVQPPS
ncbi:MAG TPA: XRE family transcriptional regulator [Solirubrobacteraceae bacterium]|jgi:transcriptional regulator with XRE-family HTH domain|nr:XRE family transcriptional regulator [Solirubrobacteraceae bacterium]